VRKFLTVHYLAQPPRKRGQSNQGSFSLLHF
jgi:hypothetical protein